MQSVRDCIIAGSQGAAVPKRLRNSKTLKHPMSDEQSDCVRDEASKFAARLLENYAEQLARRQPRVS